MPGEMEALEAIASEVKSFAADVKGLRTELMGRMDDLEKKQGRRSIGNAWGDDPARSRGEPDAEQKALGKFLRTGDDAEIKAMSAGSDPDGGYLVLPNMATTMTSKLWDQTVMRQLSRVETMTTGDVWEEPIDATDVAATWVAETQDRPTTPSSPVGLASYPLQELYANQPITQRLLDDSGINLGAWIQQKITDRFSRAEDVAFINGDGVIKPRGFMSATINNLSDSARKWGDLQYAPGGDAATITADSLRKVLWTLRTPYRTGASWIMNSNTAATIDGVKDGAGNFVWRASMAAGVPNMLLGYPVVISETMPDVTPNAYPVAFGDFKRGYLIVDRAGIKLLRDPFSSKPNVLFYVTKRVGGGVSNSEAIKLLKISVS
ncbi:MAG: phage major capsid protein [Proteobacteria bacterium]|nr:phage major capsid protein [Pseudomonadota bacterium]